MVYSAGAACLCSWHVLWETVSHEEKLCLDQNAGIRSFLELVASVCSLYPAVTDWDCRSVSHSVTTRVLSGPPRPFPFGVTWWCHTDDWLLLSVGGLPAVKNVCVTKRLILYVCVCVCARACMHACVWLHHMACKTFPSLKSRTPD